MKNPGYFGILGLRGIRVLQQYVPFRRSTVKLEFTGEVSNIWTENVARISLYEPAVSPVHWHQKRINIDGDVVDVIKALGKVRCNDN